MVYILIEQDMQSVKDKESMNKDINKNYTKRCYAK